MDNCDVHSLLKLLCSTTADAIDHYLDTSGESIEQMPEFVMSAGAAHRLADHGTYTILEANFETLKRRVIFKNKGELATAFDRIKIALKFGRIDLVILSGEQEPKMRRPVGFVEFKKWKYHEGDAFRVAELLANIPAAEFGVCVLVRNTLEDHPWHDEMRQLLGSDGFVFAQNTKPRPEKKEYCVACFGMLAHS